MHSSPQRKQYLLLLGWLLLIGIATIVPNPSLAQTHHPYFRNYTTNDGLPSPEVHYCLEDSQGYMWFATDNGVSRFDGYTFKNFGPQEGLKNPVIFHLQEASQGRIWMASMYGALYYYEQDSIYAFEHNSYIEQYTQRNSCSTDFYINEGDTIYMSCQAQGIFLFPPNATPQLLQPTNRLGSSLSLSLPNRWITSFHGCTIEQLAECDATYLTNNLQPPLEIVSDTPYFVQPLPIKTEKSSANWTKSLLGELFHFKAQNLYQIENGQVIWSQYFPSNIAQKAITTTVEGKVLMGTLTNKGLLIFNKLPDLKKLGYQQYLSGKSISQIFRDSKDGYWIATLEHGVFYCPNIEQVIIDKSTGLSTDYVAAIAFKNDSTLLIGMRDGILQKLDLSYYQLTNYPKFSNNIRVRHIIYDVLYDDKNEEIWVSTGTNAYFKKGQWKQILGPWKEGYQHAGFGKRITKQAHSDFIWGGNTSNFATISTDKKKIVFNSLNADIYERTLVVWEAKDGRI